jgi:hypothetical protein
MVEALGALASVEFQRWPALSDDWGKTANSAIARRCVFVARRRAPRTFKRKADAEAWAKAAETDLSRGLHGPGGPIECAPQAISSIAPSQIKTHESVRKTTSSRALRCEDRLAGYEHTIRTLRHGRRLKPPTSGRGAVVRRLCADEPLARFAFSMEAETSDGPLIREKQEENESQREDFLRVM